MPMAGRKASPPAVFSPPGRVSNPRIVRELFCAGAMAVPGPARKGEANTAAPVCIEFMFEGAESRTPFWKKEPAGAALACSALLRAAFSRAASATFTFVLGHAPAAAFAFAFVAPRSLFEFECPPPKIPLHQCPPPVEFAADLPDVPASPELAPEPPAGPPSFTPLPPE